jgi:urease accessory protein
MLKLDRIIGNVTDPELAGQVRELNHMGGVEYIMLEGEDTLRHRLHLQTDRGTDCAIVLSRADRLSDGAILLLEKLRAVVVRFKEERHLSLSPRDVKAALELGYFAGNMHWSVKFVGPVLRIAVRGPAQTYLERLAPLLADGRVRQADDIA